MQGTLPVTGNDEADDLLVTNPLALLLGMLGFQPATPHRARMQRDEVRVVGWG